MNVKDMDSEQYGLLFGVRRSMRYHDRRRAFFERMHRITNLLTILMAGSILFEVGRTGETQWWLTALGVIAALMAALDMVTGYSTRAVEHRRLKERFAELEIAILTEDDTEATWKNHQKQRLMIEQEEPAIYRALDLLCHNELLAAEGITNSSEYAHLNRRQRVTSHILMWHNIGAETAKKA